MWLWPFRSSQVIFDCSVRNNFKVHRVVSLSSSLIRGTWTFRSWKSLLLTCHSWHGVYALWCKQCEHHNVFKVSIHEDISQRSGVLIWWYPRWRISKSHVRIFQKTEFILDSLEKWILTWNLGKVFCIYLNYIWLWFVENYLELSMFRDSHGFWIFE